MISTEVKEPEIPSLEGMIGHTKLCSTKEFIRSQDQTSVRCSLCGKVVWTGPKLQETDESNQGNKTT